MPLLEHILSLQQVYKATVVGNRVVGADKIVAFILYGDTDIAFLSIAIYRNAIILCFNRAFFMEDLYMLIVSYSAKLNCSSGGLPYHCYSKAEACDEQKKRRIDHKKLVYKCKEMTIWLSL